MTIDDYLNLITSEHRLQPKFSEMISEDVSLPVRIQDLMASLIPKFDVDLAVGEQLDFIGQWVGVSRNVQIPIDNVYFSWDSGVFLGWDYGVWRGSFDPTSITVLPDAQYRTLIKTKIAANQWDGTTDGAYAIWDAIFTEFTILIDDHQNMSYDLAIVGGIVDSLTLALITGGYIPLKPEGVKVNVYYVPIDDGPLFGWDLETDFIQGWEEGTWARELTPT